MKIYHLSNNPLIINLTISSHLKYFHIKSYEKDGVTIDLFPEGIDAGFALPLKKLPPSLSPYGKSWGQPRDSWGQILRSWGGGGGGGGGGGQASEIDSDHASVFSPDVLGDGLRWSFDEILKWKIGISNLQSTDAFLQGIKATFWIKNVRGKRRDNAEKDKIIFYLQKLGNLQSSFE